MRAAVYARVSTTEQAEDDKITKFIEFVGGRPQADKPDWLKSFEYYFRTGRRRRCKIKQMKQKIKVGKK